MYFTDLFTTLLVLCVTVKVRSTCTSVCGGICDRGQVACSQNLVMSKARISCDWLADQCNTTCGAVYCGCIGNASSTCLKIRDECLDTGSQDSCDASFPACLVSEVSTCGYRYASTINSVAATAVSQYLPLIPYVSDIVRHGGFSEVLNLLGLDDSPATE